MRTLATYTTADQLLDYLASDATGAKWIYHADLSDWESAYNRWRERHFVAAWPATCFAAVWPKSGGRPWECNRG